MRRARSPLKFVLPSSRAIDMQFRPLFFRLSRWRKCAYDPKNAASLRIFGALNAHFLGYHVVAAAGDDMCIFDCAYGASGSKMH